MDYHANMSETPPNDPGLDSAVYSCFIHERQSGTPLSGEVVRAQIERIRHAIYGPQRDGAL